MKRWAYTGLLLSAGLCLAADASDYMTIRAGNRWIIQSDASVPAAFIPAAAALQETARERSGIEVVVGGDTRPGDGVLVVQSADIPASTPVVQADGFQLGKSPGEPRRLLLTGTTPSGLVAGLGHLMRGCRYQTGEIHIPLTEARETARMPNRGIYFATHFGNFYDRAPLEEIDLIIREMALWGTNQLIVWFDMHHFQSFDDPAAQRHLQRLRHMEKTAHSLGMQFGLGFIGNEAYAGSPVNLRAKYKPYWAHYHVELCPATDEAMAVIGRGQEGVLRAFDRVDFAWSWPFDQGGCACDKCMPWGGNGFLKVSRQLGDIYRGVHPHGRFWISTWLFDAFDEQGRSSSERLLNPDGGDYAGLFHCMQNDDPPWFDGIVIGTHGNWIPEPVRTRPRPERYPLACFPEVSMYQMHPWGGCGANPLLQHFSKLAEALRGQVVGGWPYSEGIYEDINRFFFTRFFWHPDQTVKAIAREYAAYYFGPPVADDALRLFTLLEQTLPRNGWEVQNLDGADEAFTLMQSMETRMPAWALNSWRWQVVRWRTEIDHILKHGGRDSSENRARLQRLTEQLTKLYHAQQAEPGLKPLAP